VNDGFTADDVVTHGRIGVAEARVRPERMNSPLEIRDVRLRGLHRRDPFVVARPWCHSEEGARRIPSHGTHAGRRPKNLVATATAPGPARTRRTDRRGRRMYPAATRSFGRAGVPGAGRLRAALPQDDIEAEVPADAVLKKCPPVTSF
jgi:hypothetical protein